MFVARLLRHSRTSKLKLREDSPVIATTIYSTMHYMALIRDTSTNKVLFSNDMGDPGKLLINASDVGAYHIEPSVVMIR